VMRAIDSMERGNKIMMRASHIHLI
jgi:hypothetical protein